MTTAVTAAAFDIEAGFYVSKIETKLKDEECPAIEKMRGRGLEVGAQ